MARVLITGAAGFIGFHVAQRLLADGHDVVGLDDLNADYDPALKQARLDLLLPHPRFGFRRGDVADRATVRDVFAQPLDRVVHLAAHAGVRRSVQDPRAFVATNIGGMVEILEGCREAGVRELVYASSSSVYGLASPYAATKAADEALAEVWSHLYGLSATGVRLFTVYGPWGRPDMALFSFTRAILAGRPIPLYNRGEMSRDFTYIDDAVDAIVGLLAAPGAGHRVVDVGGGRTVSLLDFVGMLEAALGVRAERELLPMQPGDVVTTRADTQRLRELTGASPQVPLDVGIGRFVEWYRGAHP